MSSSEFPAAGGRLEVHAGLPNVEILVTDGLFREVGRGTGNLALAGIPAGLYEVEARAGELIQRTLVTVRSGQSTTVAVADFRTVPTVAPVYGGATSREVHHGAATRGTLAVRDAVGPPAGLVLLVRTLAGRTHHPPRVDNLLLVDDKLRPVPSFAGRWQIDDAGQYALWSGRLEPGGYALRTAGDPPIDQSLWLSRNWTTIVVCPTGRSGPRVGDAAVQMLRLGETWDRVDDRLASALDIALSGLRHGQPLVSDELLTLMLQAKFFDPMLGIVAANALRLRKRYDRDLLDTVVRNLRKLAPDHPDVHALQYAVHDERRPRRLRWPPMLTTSYLDLLLPAESNDPRVLADGDVAERVAAYLTGAGPWLSWQAVDDITPPPPPRPLPPLAAGHDWSAHPQPGSYEYGPEEGREWRQPRPPRDAPSRPPIAEPPARVATTTGAVRIIEDYLSNAERVLRRPAEQITRDLGVAGLARRTSLPRSTVAATLRTMDLPA
jgi:hypothetical protein